MKNVPSVVTTLVVMLAGPASDPAPAPALAAPRIIMFYGGVLEGRRYMTTFDENMRFMGALSEPAPITRDAIPDRPSIEVALYWHNPTWEPYVRDTARLEGLRPEWAQPARFYLGGGQTPPVFDYYSAAFEPGLRAVSPAGLEILERHHVPVHDDRRGR